MNGPDEPAEFSRSPSGRVQDVPEKIISVVVENEEDVPVGVLEKWSSEAWIYAEADVLMAMEPEPPEDESY